MSEKTQYVEVTVKLPKPVVDFLRKFTDLVGDGFNEFIESAVVSEVNNMVKNEEIFSTPWSETEKLVKAHGLEKFLDC